MVASTSTVQASPTTHPEVFYRQTIFRIARNWARVPNAPWSRVKDPLFTQCPHSEDYENWTKVSTISQCGNFMIFLSLRFYVKSIHGVQNLPFQHI